MLETTRTLRCVMHEFKRFYSVNSKNKPVIPTARLRKSKLL